MGEFEGAASRFVRGRFVNNLVQRDLGHYLGCDRIVRGSRCSAGAGRYILHKVSVAESGPRARGCLLFFFFPVAFLVFVCVFHALATHCVAQ